MLRLLFVPFRTRISLVLLSCAWVVLTSTEIRAQDEAADAIKKLGGKVDRDDKAEGKPITVVSFGVTGVDDNALDSVKDLPTIKKLTLNGTKITDAGLEKLKGMSALEKLYLVDTKITDAGLDHLKPLGHLHVLSLVGTEVTDPGLEKLKELPELQELFLQGTKVTDAGVKSLQDAKPMLKIVR